MTTDTIVRGVCGGGRFLQIPLGVLTEDVDGSISQSVRKAGHGRPMRPLPRSSNVESEGIAHPAHSSFTCVLETESSLLKSLGLPGSCGQRTEGQEMDKVVSSLKGPLRPSERSF